jgi:hypothetical protein
MSTSGTLQIHRAKSRNRTWRGWLKLPPRKWIDLSKGRKIQRTTEEVEFIRADWSKLYYDKANR